MQETIAVVFDFDDTLAPDSTSGFLRQQGVDIRSFWDDTVKGLMADGWDPVSAYFHSMVGLSHRAAHPFTRDLLQAWGRQLPLFPGVAEIFDRLRAAARNVDRVIRVEFYLISSGIGDIIRNAPIAREFTRIWTSEFHYAADQQIEFPKKIISFTDKTRYLFHIQKGLIDADSDRDPFAVNRRVDPEQLRVPFSHMIVVGDGYTDVPCFSLVRRAGGTAIAVWDRRDLEKRGRAWGFIEDSRADTLHQADYQPDSDLSHNLAAAVERLAQKLSRAGRVA